jgi:RND family efflux transporter MFP subunit
VRTSPVKVVMDRDQIKATGTAAPTSTTKIMPLVPGLIIKLPLKEGDVVKRGQVVAILDQRQYRLTLKQAEAAIMGARVAVDATTRERKRFERLLKEYATASAQYDQVLDKFRGAQAQMKQAQVGLEMAKKALGDTMLRSPYTGVVVKKIASVGDYATSMPPTVIMVLMEISTLELKISLPEPELQRVKPGSAVEVHFPSMERTIIATVTRIIRNVDNGVHAVFIVVGGTARRREVRVAAASKGETEIISGLAGSEILVQNPSGLLDGDKVKTKATKAAAKAHGPTAEAGR